MRTPYRFEQYAKAGFVFAATTATYFFARATGVLPSWFHWGKDEVTDIAVSESTTAQMNEINSHPISNDFSLSDLSVADFEEIKLTPTQTELIIEPPDSEEQYLAKTELTPYRARRRLLQKSSVSVINPIPDQVIEVNQQYVYPLDDVFVGDYSLLDAVETGQNSLPSWLSLQPKLLSTFPSGSGSAYQVAISGSTAFLANEAGLQIIDVNNASSPRLLSFFLAGSGGAAIGVAISGSTAFVAEGYAGLQIIDVSNPSSPRLLSSFPAGLGGLTRAVAINGSTAFVADDTQLQIIDVSNSSSPQLMSSFPLSGGSAYGVVISGNTAFVAYGGVGLQIIDVSNLRSPHLLSSFSDPAAQGLAISRGTVFFAANALQIIDVSNTSSPRLISYFPAGASGTGYACGVAISGNTVFVADGLAGLQIVDVSNLSSPCLLSSYPRGTGYTVGVAIIGSTAFVADGTAGLQVIDVSRGSLIGVPPLSLLGQSLSITISARNVSQELMSDRFTLVLDQFPRVVTSSVGDQSVYPGGSLTLLLNSGLLFVNPGNTFLKLSVVLSQGGKLPAWLNLNVQPILLSIFAGGNGVTINGSTAFVSAANAGLQIFDVSNPSSPRLLSTFSGGYAYGVAISGSKAFVADDIQLQIIDVSNQSSLRLLSSYPTGTGSAHGVAISGNTVFVVEGTAGLKIIDVSNSSSPRLLSSFPAGSAGEVYGVAISGNTALVADGFAGLQLIDISNLSSPRLLSSFPTGSGGLAKGVVISGDTAFVADWNVGLQIINVSNVSSPRLLSSFPAGSGGTAYGVAISGSMAFVADYDQLQIIDISNMSSPLLSASFPMVDAIGVVISGSTAFVVAGGDLQILDISQWQLTANPGVVDVGNYKLQLMATDELGGSVSTQPFTIRVEGPPQIHGLIPTQYAKINQAFNYFVPQGLITDPNFDPITFNATLSSGQLLPDWLQFNAISATFAGTPQSSDVGNYTIILSATDNIAGTVNTTFNLLINDVPALNRPISSQLANIGLLYQLILSVDTFSNPNIGGLNYSAQQSNGLALPAWLKFNTTQRSFRGLPQSSNVGRYGLSVVAVDQYNGQATAPFILLVEFPPQINQLIASQFAGVETAFIYPISANTFIDPSGNSLSYSAAQSSGAVLPNWLSFNPETLIFSGTPLPADIGILPVEVTAINSNGGQAQQSFNVTVTYFPQVARSIPAQLTDVGVMYEFIIANTTFTDPDDPVLIYSAQWSGHPRLPEWLNFDDTLLRLSGTPNGSDTGQYLFVVSASDTYGALASTELTLVVDSFPRLNRPVVSQLAGVGLAFSLAIPANTFMDPDEEVLTYQIQSTSGSNLPNWLSFNPQTLVLAGVPQVTDLADLSLRLTATDPVGGEAQQNFNLSVINFPMAVNSIPDQLTDIGLPYQLTLTGNLFQYQNLTALIYSVQQSDGAVLPDWLHFNATSLQLRGTPNLTDAGLWTLAVIAANARGAQAQVIFNLRVESFPRVNQPIAAQLAGINLPYALSIPADAFQDDDDESLTYQASQNNSAPLPNWLSFNPYALSFSGVPRVTDLGELVLRLTVTDAYGGWAQQNFNLSVLYFPQLIQPIAAQLVDIGALFHWMLPNHTFQDPGGRTLAYSAQQKNGLALPGWLSFNATSLQFLGIANTTDAGTLDLTVIARNSAGAQATAPFTLQVEHFPQWQRIISDRWAGVGVAFSFTLPVDTVVDQDSEPLVYQAMGADDSPLPNWLSFNPQSLTFLGVPLEINLGALPILLTVKDPAGASISGNFTVNVIHFPAVTETTLPAPSTVWSGQTLTYFVPSTTFSDPDHLIQSYQATLVDGGALPAWLTFNASSLVFSGIPSDSDAGALSLRVIAQDSHQIQASVTLSLVVSANLPPQLINPISDQTATVGDPFEFFVPADTFVDPEGEPLSYAATQAGATSLPDWLSFDENGLSFSGTPQGQDTDTYSARTVPIVLTAKDTRSQSQAIFNINVLGTSNWQLAIKVSAPLISILTALIAVYRERALCLNRYHKQRYQHPPQTVEAGSTFEHRLSTVAERIHKIEVKLSEPAHGRCRFFRSDQRTLPGNASLPSWMDYDTNTNTLHSKSVVPVNTPSDLVVNVKGSGDVILEQFKLTVTGRFREEKGMSQILEASGAGSPVSLESSSRDKILTFS